jgi:hypothetical protein
LTRTIDTTIETTIEGFIFASMEMKVHDVFYRIFVFGFLYYRLVYTIFILFERVYVCVYLLSELSLPAAAPRCPGYLVHLIAGRATEDYSSLADAVGSDAPGADFVGVLTNLFKDIAVAVEENEALLRVRAGIARV